MFCVNNSNELTDEFEIELTDKNECEIVETCIQLMTDYINQFPRAISDTNFHEQMIDEIKILFIETFVEKKIV